MKRILITGALLAAPLIVASLTGACGWFGDMFVGPLLALVVIIATGAMAETIVPGSGVLVMKALEAWLNAS